MAAIGKQNGQRGNTTSASGRKQRSETSTPHSGSRMDPSHATEKARSDRAKKTATQAKAKAAPAKAGKKGKK